MKVNPAINI